MLFNINVCPIYEQSAAKSGQHIKEAFEQLALNFESENTIKEMIIKSQREIGIIEFMH